MLELLVADPGYAAQFVQRRRARRGDAVDGRIVQHHISRHAAAARDFAAPRFQCRMQRRIARAVAGRRCGPDRRGVTCS